MGLGALGVLGWATGCVPVARGPAAPPPITPPIVGATLTVVPVLRLGAVDGGSVVIDSGAAIVVREPAGGGAPIAIGTPGQGPGQLAYPVDAYVDAGGVITVVDAGNRRLVRFAADGAPLDEVGDGHLQRPRALAVDAQGHRWVCDSAAHAIVVFGPSGEVIRRFGEHGEGPAELDTPRDIAVAAELVYVADAGNARVQVYDLAGAHVRSIGSYGAGPGQLKVPRSLVVASGRLYVADAAGAAVHVFELDGTFVERRSVTQRDGGAAQPLAINAGPGGGASAEAAAPLSVYAIGTSAGVAPVADVQPTT
jgi:DNA-binding beta-propeller fold protein YncE